ncbi:hypothetical protein QBC47DRAFT_202429 [Echria macrotheca]|uniref:Uncharacterized protein n=1 Tax=Echria macrotheca TaxID=438768 RepID=A0AAJ0BFF1_9PEZI|nr:hypothetical protein QBC47DRAFT_202429 [Echria macrotheca]
MAALAPPSVTQITATSILPIGNRDESVSLQRNVPSDLWNSNSPNGADDGPTGSLKPVGFQLGKPIAMSINGTANYPIDWPEMAKGNYLIIGSIQYGNGPKIDVLRGKWPESKVTDPAPRPEPILSVPFTVSLEMIDPLPADKKITDIPWGFAGDVEWRIQPESELSLQLVVPTKTRLEMYQLGAIAPGGPTEARSAESTLPNFQGKWPVHLLRLFVPGPSELQGSAADIQANKVSWWAKYICRKVSSLGEAYDALEGRSGYGVGILGGSFDMTSFYDKVLLIPPYPKVSLGLNSFDTTSLVEAAFWILLPAINASDTPRPKVTWIGLTPCGEIADPKVFQMVPLGWQNDAAAQGVSTPFFKGNLAVSKKPEDGALAATAWLEIQMNPTTTFVVQIAFNVKGPNDQRPRPDLGDETRSDFLIRHFKDEGLNGRTTQFFDSTTVPQVSDATKAGDNLGRRAGLYNLRGVNEPWPWLYSATSGKPSMLPMPPSLRAAIALRLPDAKNSASTAKRLDLVNAGSLRPHRIYALLKPKVVVPGSNVPQPDHYNGKTDYFRLVVGRGVSVASYICLLDATGKLQELKDVKARVKISTFEKFSDALDGLVTALGGFECDISKIIQSNAADTTYGHYMVRTTQSLLFVRNNLLTDITILDLASYTSAAKALLNLASILDKDFVANTVPRCQARKAAFDITSPAPPLLQNMTKVFVDKPFAMTLSNVDLLAEELGVNVYSGQKEVGQPIIFTSAGPQVADTVAGTSTRTLSFLPLQCPASGALDVDLAVTGAHYDTFHPVTRIVTVKLQK